MISRCAYVILAKLSQHLWTTKPKSFYHPNQLRTICVIESFSSWLTVPLGVVVQTRWLNLAINNIIHRSKGIALIPKAKAYIVFAANTQNAQYSHRIAITLLYFIVCKNLDPRLPHTNHLQAKIKPFKAFKKLKFAINTKLD